jgi:hypothetical protein
MANPISAPVSPVFLPLQILLIGIDLLVSRSVVLLLPLTFNNNDSSSAIGRYLIDSLFLTIDY